MRAHHRFKTSSLSTPPAPRKKRGGYVTGNRICEILYKNNMETVAGSRGARRRSSEHTPASSSAYSGLRAQPRLEQQLLKLKDGNGNCSQQHSHVGLPVTEQYWDLKEVVKMLLLVK